MNSVETKTCETPGCFNTTYDSRECSQCLNGETPLKRGPVTAFELSRARSLGGVDAEVTRQRLLKHGQPTGDL